MVTWHLCSHEACGRAVTSVWSRGALTGSRGAQYRPCDVTEFMKAAEQAGDTASALLLGELQMWCARAPFSPPT